MDGLKKQKSYIEGRKDGFCYKYLAFIFSLPIFCKLFTARFNRFFLRLKTAALLFNEIHVIGFNRYGIIFHGTDRNETGIPR